MDHEEIVVRVPKGWKGTVTVNSASNNGESDEPHGPVEEEKETHFMDESFDPFEGIPGSMLSARVIDGHGVKTLVHRTPDENLNAIREMVQGIHEAIAAKNPSAPLRVVEIGPWVGESTIAMCQGFGPAGGVLTSIDTFAGTTSGYLEDVVEEVGGPERIREIFLANLGQYYDNPVKVLQMTSMRAARDLNIGVGQLDLVFLDGCYEPVSVSDDIRCWAELVSRGGVLAGQFCGPEAAKAQQSLRAVLASLGCQLRCYEGTTVWAVLRNEMVMKEESMFNA